MFLLEDWFRVGNGILSRRINGEDGFYRSILTQSFVPGKIYRTSFADEYLRRRLMRDYCLLM